MIGVFRGQFSGVWSGGVRVRLLGFPLFDLPRVWLVAMSPGIVDEPLMVEGRPSIHRLVTCTRIELHRIDLAHPIDCPGPLESDVTDRWTDRWGREWLRVTLYVEDEAAWRDRFAEGRGPEAFEIPDDLER